ncbi:MAG: NAD-dependent epimerase [Desulfovermiculus sp.]
MHILVTGAAGFIGYHLARRLTADGHSVLGLDNLSPYYSVELKKDRLHQLCQSPRFEFVTCALEQKNELRDLFARHSFDCVVNLAAQAGVRYSLTNPEAYIDTNLVGFGHILECCRQNEVKHLVFASSSSVYGLNTTLPFSVHDNVDHPISLYAASKKANELMAHTYSYLYNLPCTGLRFFTVYGPWGRPDMALFLFTEAILKDRPIQVFNYGRMERDFTYIDDIVEGIVRVIHRVPSPNSSWNSSAPDPSSSLAPYKLYNIGNNNSVQLMHFIQALETCLGREARKEYLPLQPGDVPRTYADVQDLQDDVGFCPNTPVEQGIQEFVHWYLWYYHSL